MARVSKSLSDNSLLEAALEGLQAQRQRIEEQIKEVQQRLGGRRAPRAAGPATAKAPASRKRRELSSAARKRIAAAQKKRWAEYRKQQKPE